jgi:EAL domain-containing protein (putative c-di-GMP-specific phosphodiesterase class I)
MTAPMIEDVVVLAHDAHWAEAARTALNGEVGGVVTVDSADAALRRLLDPFRPVSHFLLEPAAAGPALRDLVDMTAGEPAARTRLVWLGRGRPPPRNADTADDPRNLLLLPVGTERRDGTIPVLNPRDVAVAIGRGQIINRYQPIVGLRDRVPVAVETLARWEHPRYGTVAPDAFVPVAERADLAGFLTEHVTFRALAELAQDVLVPLQLGVTLNFPLNILLVPESLARLEAVGRAVAVTPQSIIIELTESRPVTDLGALRRAADRLISAGYRLALDDVGPDIRNHEALLTLPFAVVKLDKRIVRAAPRQPAARNFIARVVASARRRSVTVVAEGIEDQPTWDLMRELDVDHAQGFLASRPLPAPLLPVWAEVWRSAK